jgi:hypothetical protein
LSNPRKDHKKWYTNVDIIGFHHGNPDYFYQKNGKTCVTITICDYSLDYERNDSSQCRQDISVSPAVVGNRVHRVPGGGGHPGRPGEEPFLLFGWITMPLFIGIIFVLFWLISYIIYFFFFWPYR